ncbi:hypothetical protein VLK31_07985 [Variovorax sp. H27-G14]|uniref:hypothetical protein n=1 Tax=Variovorax sp. H27-G14 TaxID=3111914 RepID=UPI0038FC9889
MTVNFPLGIAAICFAVGLLGAALAAWVCARSARLRLEAQSHAFALAREKAGRDLQQALLCIPQWMQQTVRLELELLGRQQAERWKDLVREQQRWHAEQDRLHQAQWHAVLAASSGLRRQEPVPAAPAMTPPKTTPAPTPVPLRARPPEPQKLPLAAPSAMAVQTPPEQELTDEEIDALPPELPAPAPPAGKKWPAPRRPVLRNI